MASIYSELKDKVMSQALEVTSKGQDKIARYGWSVKSERGTFMMIKKGDLLINNAVYQRDGKPNKVLELASAWSWIACGTITVAKRDGKYWTVDGQHRKLAADRRSDIQELPCMVFEVEDVSTEARAFIDTNRNRKPVSALDTFKAQIVSGDTNAQFVQEIIECAGMRIAQTCQNTGEFKAVALALDIASKDRAGFVKTIDVASKLAIEAEKPVTARLIAALYYLHTHIPGGLDNGPLVKRLKQIGVKSLSRGIDSAAQYYGRGGAKIYAQGMLEAINKGLRNHFTVSGDEDA
jgi:hypothetical protein